MGNIIKWGIIMNAKIKVDNLVKVFGQQPHHGFEMLNHGATKTQILSETGLTLAVNNFSFTVLAGEFFVIMGLSGSGKSTVLRCLNRLIEPDAGIICIDGVDITKLNPQELRLLRQQKIAMVFQQFGLFPHRTVLENASFGLEVRGVEKSDREEIARTYLNLVGLSGWEDSYPENLSGGMRQRVGLARALANDPEILLMDEAFNALDPLIRQELQGELLKLQQQLNKTIVFVTHDFNEAVRLADRIAFIKDGALIQVGQPKEIIANPVDEYVAKFVTGLTVRGGKA